MSVASPRSLTLQKGLFGLSLPLLGEYALNFSVPLIDIFFLSAISDEATAAVGAVVPWFFMLLTLFNAISIAGASVASQYMGQQRYDEANLSIGGFLLLGLGLSFVAALIFILFHQHIGLWMGLSTHSAELASIYLLYVGTATGLLGMRTMLGNVCNCYGRSEWNMSAAVVMIVTNILGNCILVLGWFGVEPMGVQGLALATVGSWVLSLAWQLYVVMGIVKIQIPWLALRKRMLSVLAPINKIAVPSALEPFSYHASLMALNMMIARLGDEEMAARTYGFNLFYLCVMVAMSISVANQMIVTQYLGQTNYTQASEQMKISKRYLFFIVAVISCLLVGFSQPLLNQYTLNEDILSLGFGVMILFALAEPFRSLNILVANALRGCGDAVFATGSAVLITWCFTVPFAYFLGFYLGYGLYGILVASLLDQVLRYVVNEWRWQQGKWQKTVEAVA